MNQQESFSVQTPSAITAGELRLKLIHLANVLTERAFDSIVLRSEGAMRWLTGLKHQLGDIAPFAVSPVNAQVRVQKSGGFQILIVSKSFEMPRLRMEIPQVFDEAPEIKYDFVEMLPAPESRTLDSDHADYQRVLDRIIRPVLGGPDGNPYTKLNWLSNATMAVLEQTARALEPGMDGLTVRGLMLQQLAWSGIDANLVLIALSGQETHLHPIASAAYKMEKKKWNKLVVGSRFAEHIISQTLMVKLGGEVSAEEKRVYRALQQTSVEYADCYRSGRMENDIYTGMLERFEEVERDSGLKGFAASATLHHPGGGTSPLGNRDWMIDPSGSRRYEPWTQFAINPVDVLMGFKVELQGMIQPDGAPPVILGMDGMVSCLPFCTVVSRYGTTARLPDLLVI